MSQAVIPHMRGRKSGSIVCMSSVSAQRGGGIFGGPHYSAAKAGVLGLGKAMARELGPDNIRVNCGDARPDPDRHHRRQADAGAEAGNSQGHSARPARRRDDVANFYLFLASDLSAYLTGVTIDVNGGMLIH